MAAKTGIEWCDTTVNSTTGCDGCELWQVASERNPDPIKTCYAGIFHESRLSRSLPNLYAPEFTEVRLAPGRMAKAAALSDLKGKAREGKPWIRPSLPRLIFVGDLGDLFSEAVPFEYLRDEVLAAIDSPAGRRHVWMILTKRPARFAEFAERAGGLPPNLWAGTSITNRASLKRAALLREVPASRRFLSVEPLIEEVDLRPHLADDRRPDLVIVGGESDQKSRARPFDLAWARSLRDQVRKTGTAFFLKQLGSRPYNSAHRIDIDGPGSHAVALDLRDSHGGDWNEWPADLRVREMPRPEEVSR